MWSRARPEVRCERCFRVGGCSLLSTLTRRTACANIVNLSLIILLSLFKRLLALFPTAT